MSGASNDNEEIARVVERYKAAEREWIIATSHEAEAITRRIVSAAEYNRAADAFRRALAKRVPELLQGGPLAD